jgi:ring-1,2-phenylacetyl-CoA epoxidase subunit PaaD
MIAADVRDSVASVPGVDEVTVEWLPGPVWSTDRMSGVATRRLSEYTVVLRRKDGTVRCPVCGSDAVADQSMAGPTRCRSIAWCDACRNPVEVMRTSHHENENVMSLPERHNVLPGVRS